MAKLLLSANEAVAFGAYKAGCAVAAAYPGTPSTEILENIAARFKDRINCEWSVNEKVAAEVAIGASIYGARSVTAMKHVGLNVALDPIMTYTFQGPSGGFVVFIADDPGMHSSQNEQDSRNLVRFAKTLMLEPADSQEAFDMTVAAFDISEKFRAPVFVRLTTRTSHTSTVVDVGDDFAYGEGRSKPYKKDVQRYVSAPLFARRMRLEAELRTAALTEFACTTEFNRIESGDTRLGIIASGVAYQLVKEVFPDFTVLKLGCPIPLPKTLVKQFAASVDRLLVVEELDPVIEEQIRAMGLPVVEHTVDLSMMELNPDRILALRREVLGEAPVAVPVRFEGTLPTRPPVLCAGCSHRGLFYVLSKLGATVTGDIGCYTLGAFPPLSGIDTVICMGASIGSGSGFEAAGKTGRLAAVIGDSTFFHSGLTGIANVAYNKRKLTTIVVDNSITAMTGHQDNPGTGKTIMGEPAPQVNIAESCRALGIRRVREADAYNLAELEKILAEELDAPEASVVVVKGPCVISAKKVNAGTCSVKAECKACGACFKLGCPAIVRGDKVDEKRFKARIDPILCSGCDMCRQLCRFNAIERIR